MKIARLPSQTSLGKTWSDSGIASTPSPPSSFESSFLNGGDHLSRAPSSTIESIEAGLRSVSSAACVLESTTASNRLWRPRCALSSVSPRRRQLCRATPTQTMPRMTPTVRQSRHFVQTPTAKRAIAAARPNQTTMHTRHRTAAWQRDADADDEMADATSSSSACAFTSFRVTLVVVSCLSFEGGSVTMATWLVNSGRVRLD